MEQKPNKALNISLWVAQALLALGFGMAGMMKLTMPVEELLTKGMSFVAEYSVTSVRLIGTAEILAVLGLILPAALRILPILTPLAAAGTGTIMVLATFHHISHSEPFIPTVVLFSLSAFVVWGRLLKAPISPR